MSELLAGQDIEQSVDNHYEQYLKEITRMSVIGFIALDSLSVLALEISRRPITEEIGKVALATTIIAFAPIAFMKVTDSIKSHLNDKGNQEPKILEPQES
jgi:hypothetical protein